MTNSDIKMKLEGTYFKAKFLRRPNRFLSYISIEDQDLELQAHVPDPGRLKELLIPNAEILVRQEQNTQRKTKYSLVGVKFGDIWVNIDSIFTNRIFEREFHRINEFLDYKIIKSEYTFGKSRFDFLLENKKNKKKTLVEIKGVTLVENNVAMFPDAPTARGARHVKELSEALELGYETFIVFVVKRKDSDVFKPNWKMDPLFAANLLEAHKKGVGVIVVTCDYDPVDKKEINIVKQIPFTLELEAK